MPLEPRLAEGSALPIRDSTAVGVIVEQEIQKVWTPRQCRTSLYLFACHLEWSAHGRLAAYEELVAALDDSDEDIRIIAETLLHRSSPRRQVTEARRPAERL